MSLFPTLHATGDLPPAHRSHLERHGITLVGADDDPDVVLVLPGTDPCHDRAGTVVVATGDDGPATVALLAAHGIVGAPDAVDRARSLLADVGVPGPAGVDERASRCRCAPSSTVGRPAVPLLRLGERGPVVAAGARDEDGAALLALGVDPLVGSPGACS